MTFQIHKSIIQKWAIPILSILYYKQELHYNDIKNILQIPSTTLTTRLNDLTKYKYLEKQIYGSIRKPHHTTYKITDLGVQTINNLLLPEI